MQGPFDHADVLPLASELGSTERPLFRAIFLAALVLLALGGLNVSGLMAARGLDRARELGLRRALGATGLRIARLVFLEALVPIAVGAAIGLTLAVPLLQVGLRLLPEDLVLLKPQMAPAIDARVVMFVVLSAIASRDADDDLADSSRAADAARRRSLMAAEAAPARVRSAAQSSSCRRSPARWC